MDKQEQLKGLCGWWNMFMINTLYAVMFVQLQFNREEIYIHRSEEL